MPIEYNIPDLNPINNEGELVNKFVEVADASGKNFKAGVALLIQAVANNQPGANSLKSLVKSVKCYDTTDPQYIPGDSTLVGLAPDTLCVGAIAWVQHPAPARWHRLVQDPSGNVGPVSIDGAFTSTKTLTKWVEVDSTADRASAVPDYSPFASHYALDEQVKYTLDGYLRLFVAKQALTPVNGRIPAPTGLSTDANWAEISATETSEAGRLLITAPDAQAQRRLLNDPRIAANQYGSHPAFSSEDGPDGSWAWVIKAVLAATTAQVVKAPAAPTLGQVDDTADTFSFLPNPAYPSFAQYKVNGLPGVTGAVVLDATNSYVQGGRIYLKVPGTVLKGGLAVYVAGSANVPDGEVLSNTEPFTGTGGSTVGGTYTPSGDENASYNSVNSPMPNQINASGTRKNTTQPLEFKNPKTDVWVRGRVTSTPGGDEFAAVLTGVDAKVYPVGTLAMRIVGFPEIYYNTVAVTVTNSGSANQKPSVSFAPVTSSTPTVGVAKDYLALATDSDGSISLVELVRVTSPSDLTVLAVLASDATSPYSLSWTPTAVGTVYLAARATDNSGESSFSSVLTVAVQSAGSTPSATPIITSFAPATATVGSTVVLTGSNFTGVKAVQLSGVAVASYTVDSDTRITLVLAASSTTGKFRATGANNSVGTSSTDFVVKQLEVNFAFQGDSITFGAGLQPNEAHPAQVAAAMGAHFTAVNIGKSGHTTVDGLQDALQTDATYDAARFTHNFASLFLGTNDVSTGVPAATTKSNIEKWHRDRIALGFKTFAVTILLKTNPRSFDAQINDINQHIRDNWQSWGCTGLIDINRIADLQYPADRTLFQDGTHPTALGQQYIAREFKRQLDAYYASVNFPVTPYVWQVDAVGNLYRTSGFVNEILENVVDGTATGNSFTGGQNGSFNGQRKAGPSAAVVRASWKYVLGQGVEGIIGINENAPGQTGYNDLQIADYISSYLGRMNLRNGAGGSDDTPFAAGQEMCVQLETSPFNGAQQVSFYIDGKKWMSYQPAGGFAASVYQFDAWVQNSTISNIQFWADNPL